MVKRILVFLVLICVASSVGAQAQSQIMRFKPIAPPNAELMDVNGRVIDFDDYKTPLIFVHFWATWCGPCVVEFPALLDFMRAAPGQASLIAVSNDFSRAAMEGFMRKHPASDLPVSWVLDDRMEIAKGAYQIQGVPQTFILGPDRKMIGLIPRDADWADKKLRAELTAMAKGTK